MKIPRKRYLAPLSIFFIGLAFSLSAFFSVYEWQRRSLENEFIQRSQDRSEIFRNELNRHLEVLYYLRGLYSASTSVNRGEFQRFTEEILLHHPDIPALSWVPRVAGVQRSDFEAATRKEGYEDFQITRVDDQGKPIVSSESKEYFPIHFVEPLSENKIIFGFDVASDPARKEAMDKASIQESAVATSRLKLIRRTNSFGCRLFLPVYFNSAPHNTPEECISDVRGFVSVLFDIGRTMETSFEGLSPLGIDVYLFDDSAADKSKKFLYFHSSRLRSAAAEPDEKSLSAGTLPLWSTQFNVAGRKWMFICRPLPELFAASKFLQAWMVLAAGVFLAFLVAFYIFDLANRSARIEALVNERTATLKESERALEREKEKAELLYKVVPSAIFTVDKGCRITSWNDKAADLTGFSAEEVTGKPCLLFSDLPCKDECLLHSLKINKPVIDKECAIIRKDGKLRRILKSIDVLKDEEGNMIGGIESFEDITERKQTEEQLNRAYQVTWDILANAPFGIYLVNIKGGVDFVNPAMLAISGAGYEQFRDLNIFELATYKNVGLDEKIRGCLEGNGFFMEAIEYTSYFSRRETIRNFTGIPLSQQGEKKALVIVEDITERRRLEKLKAEFVSNVSHELRTPLSIIKEGVGLVLDKIVGEINPKQENVLATVKDNIDRLARIIDELLDISKIEAGKLQLKRSEIDIVGLIKQIAAGFEIKIKGKDLDLRLNFSGQQIPVYADTDKLTEVFVNLLGNAVKFTAKGYIEVSAQEKEGTVECYVKDTGIGIAEENLPKMFDKFQQFGRVSGPGEKGTGLGLSIAKGIVEMHGGSISIESRLGEGAKFVFRLPKRPEVLP